MTTAESRGTLSLVVSTDWQAKVDFMRANGITSATWGDSGLASCTLGPAVAVPSTEQSEPDLSNLAKKEAASKARTYFAAGGGVVPRGKF